MDLTLTFTCFILSLFHTTLSQPNLAALLGLGGFGDVSESRPSGSGSCPYQSHPDRRKFSQMVNNRLMTQECAPGTIFVLSKCSCDNMPKGPAGGPMPGSNPRLDAGLAGGANPLLGALLSQLQGGGPPPQPRNPSPPMRNKSPMISNQLNAVRPKISSGVRPDQGGNSGSQSRTSSGSQFNPDPSTGLTSVVDPSVLPDVLPPEILNILAKSNNAAEAPRNIRPVPVQRSPGASRRTAPEPRRTDSRPTKTPRRAEPPQPTKASNNLGGLELPPGGLPPDVLKMLQRSMQPPSPKADKRSNVNKQPRSQNQNTRSQNQNTRSQNQNTRSQNHNTRSQNQNTRSQNHSARSQSQNTRSQNHSARSQSQNTRSQNKSTRSQNQNTRTQNQSARSQSQNARLQNQRLPPIVPGAPRKPTQLPRRSHTPSTARESGPRQDPLAALMAQLRSSQGSNPKGPQHRVQDPRAQQPRGNQNIRSQQSRSQQVRGQRPRGQQPFQAPSGAPRQDPLAALLAGVSRPQPGPSRGPSRVPTRTPPVGLPRGSGGPPGGDPLAALLAGLTGGSSSPPSPMRGGGGSDQLASLLAGLGGGSSSHGGGSSALASLLSGGSGSGSLSAPGGPLDLSSLSGNVNAAALLGETPGPGLARNVDMTNFFNAQGLAGGATSLAGLNNLNVLKLQQLDRQGVIDLGDLTPAGLMAANAHFAG